MGPRPSGRFPAGQRVRRRSEYQRIQSKARRVSTPHFALLLHARDDSAGPRLGIVVSRRVGIAAVRNRAKRLTREAFRSTRDLWPDDIDVVVVVRRPTGDAKLADIVAEWRQVSGLVARRCAEAREDRSRRATKPPT